MVFDARGIASDEAVFQPAKTLFHHVGAGFERRFTNAGKASVGVDLQEDEIAPAQSDLVDRKAGDFELAGIRRWVGKNVTRR